MKCSALCLILAFFAGTASAADSGPDRSPIRPKIGAVAELDQPFSAFRNIDQILTVLDRDGRILRSHADATARLQNWRRQAAALRQIQQSREMREMSRSSQRLTSISGKAETLYRKRNQRYGALLFHQLHMKAAAMQEPITRQSKQTTLSGVAREQRKFSQRLLSFVLQFQTVSGGYGALACDPGGWACCQPRLTSQDDKTQLRGCTWVCASTARLCRGGCLGPQTPNTAAAVQPNKPRLSKPSSHDNPYISVISKKK